MSDVVTDALLRMIAKQVDDRGIVVWYDPEHAYSVMVTELVLALRLNYRSQAHFRIGERRWDVIF